MRHLFLLSCLLICCSCTVELFGKVESRSYYVLQDKKESVHPLVGKSANITIVDNSSARYVNGQKIAFGQNSSQRGYYQYASWFDSPAKRVPFLIRQRFEQLGFSTWLSERKNEQKSFQLNTELIDIYHDTSDKPGAARIVIAAELIDLTGYQSLGKKTFVQNIKLKDYEVESAVDSFNVGVAIIIDDLSAWVLGFI
ncbi:MAG: membrane integrity-associated transporter subunit PqiC [Deltaproteobacteria bacterium]|nr:membrane integrity-associated transporter subunit PqiC [Deltaproteobacteria bacterium]